MVSTLRAVSASEVRPVPTCDRGGQGKHCIKIVLSLPPHQVRQRQEALASYRADLGYAVEGTRLGD